MSVWWLAINSYLSVVVGAITMVTGSSVRCYSTVGEERGGGVGEGVRREVEGGATPNTKAWEVEERGGDRGLGERHKWRWRQRLSRKAEVKERGGGG